MGADSLGLVWALPVTAADVRDRDGGCRLLGGVRRALARVREVIAGSGSSKRFREFVRGTRRWRVTTTGNAADGFAARARRRVVGRTFAWFVRYRRLMVDSEYLPETREAVTYAAMTHRMVRRLRPPE